MTLPTLPRSRATVAEPSGSDGPSKSRAATLANSRNHANRHLVKCSLVAAGKTVGVASQSHKAIHNVLDAIDAPFVGKKKASTGNPESYYEREHVENVTDNDDVVDCDVAAGTAWLFADPTHDQTLDYLFIDEAGQVSLADALAMATCARNVILVGDPQQLAQVIQGSHPQGSAASVLTHLRGLPPQGRSLRARCR